MIDDNSVPGGRDTYNELIKGKALMRRALQVNKGSEIKRHRKYANDVEQKHAIWRVEFCVI